MRGISVTSATTLPCRAVEGDDGGCAGVAINIVVAHTASGERGISRTPDIIRREKSSVDGETASEEE